MPQIDNPETKSVFVPGQNAFYPSQGVGKITGLETMDVSGQSIRVLVLYFAFNNLTLRIPIQKIPSSGLRPISAKKPLTQALAFLKSRPERRHHIYAKHATMMTDRIKTGDPLEIAVVIRDTWSAMQKTDAPYTEKQFYILARHQLASEIAISFEITLEQAIDQIENNLQGRTRPRAEPTPQNQVDEYPNTESATAFNTVAAD
jgi:CarD family transcriptional regulator